MLNPATTVYQTTSRECEIIRSWNWYLGTRTGLSFFHSFFLPSSFLPKSSISSDLETLFFSSVNLSGLSRSHRNVVIALQKRRDLRYHRISFIETSDRFAFLFLSICGETNREKREDQEKEEGKGSKRDSDSNWSVCSSRPDEDSFPSRAILLWCCATHRPNDLFPLDSCKRVFVKSQSG